MTRVAPCCYCDQTLHFVTGEGWLHPDGNLYVTRDGRDDHCGTPNLDRQRLVAS